VTATRAIRLLALAAFLGAGAARASAQQRDEGISVAGLGHDKGQAGARVFIIEFGDFGCSYCAKFAGETYPAIDSLYVRNGQVRWKYVPFVTGMFRNSREVSEAAECAGEQGGFWKMHDLLYQKRKEWMASKAIGALIARYARELRLDATKIARCAARPDIRARIARNDGIAQQLGIRGTPTFFVNGRGIPGAIPLDLFIQVIEAAKR
jgi:protein-disulfide isomerase